MIEAINTADRNELVLVLGATGKTGRRVVSSLRERGVPVRRARAGLARLRLEPRPATGTPAWTA
jgi:uncharacterized protein YbjT (DUF2867 family)